MPNPGDFLLLLPALLFGLRHGIDWDHIAAITDITTSQDAPRESVILGTVYALGHATVVTSLGLLAVLIGVRLPNWVDAYMEPVVGFTLIVLGLWVVYSILKEREDFKMRSRWMLLFHGVMVLYSWITGKLTGHTRPHRELHQQNYGLLSAFSVGLLHGIGAETPTQVLLFVLAAGAGGTALGVGLLLVFVFGLLISNSLITLLTTFGYVRAHRNSKLFMVLGTMTALFSMVIGFLFLTGQAAALPAILGG